MLCSCTASFGECTIQRRRVRRDLGEGDRVTDWKTIDYFADPSLVEDPYPYFDELRSECPVLSLPHLGVVAVTGYDAAMEIYKDTDTFSSCNSVIGPFVQFPVPLEGDDITEIV